MKLNEAQIQYIREYIDAFDIKYYELREEFLDHIINSVEARMATTDVPFIRAVTDAKDAFGHNGFKVIMTEREKSLTLQYKKQFQGILRGYFKFPQIFISLLFAIAVFVVSAMFEKPVKVMLIIIFGAMLLAAVQIIESLRYRKVNRHLLLEMHVFYNTFGFAVIIPNLCMGMTLFKDSADFGSPLLMTVFSILSTVSFMSFLSYRKLKKEVVGNIKKLYFN